MATATKQHEMFIGGEWTGAAEGRTQPVINPATAETIAEVPAASETDVPSSRLRVHELVSLTRSPARSRTSPTVTR